MHLRVDLNKIFNDVLTEAISREDIITAIENKMVVRINYGGNASNNDRIIEIHTFGLDHNGMLIIDAFQVSGDTETENNKFKTFKVDLINSILDTGKFFNSSRPKWKENRNKKFSKVIKQIS